MKPQRATRARHFVHDLRSHARLHPDQDLAIQHAALTAAGCAEFRAEKVSGTSRAGRLELDALLTFKRKGDTLMLTRIDRLARSVGDPQDIVRAMKAKACRSRLRSSRSTQPLRPAAHSLSCWACSPTSRRTSARNGR